jgi:hypothetical protein
LILRALSEIETGELKSFAQLSDKDKGLLQARLFPEISLTLSRALLDGDFFALSDLHRLQLLQGMGFETTEVQELLAKAHQTPHEKTREFKRDLLLHFFKPAPLIVSETDRLMKDRAEMLKLIQENPQAIESGIYPRDFISFLMVRFFPTPHHMRNERQRFSDEWNRQVSMAPHLKRIEELQKKWDRETDEARRTEIAAAIEAELVIIEESFLQFPLELGSDAQTLAAFLYGFTPQSLSDWRRVGLAAASGFAFATAFRLFGWRAMMIVSLPLGYWSLQSLEETWQLLHQATQTDDLLSRQEAWQRLGRITSDATAGAFGFRLQFASLDWGRAVRLRQLNRLHHKRQRLLDQRRTIISEIKTIDLRIQNARQTLLTATPDEATQLTKEIIFLEKHRSDLSTLSDRSGSVLLDTWRSFFRLSARSLELLTPVRSLRRHQFDPALKWSQAVEKHHRLGLGRIQLLEQELAERGQKLIHQQGIADISPYGMRWRLKALYRDVDRFNKHQREGLDLWRNGLAEANSELAHRGSQVYLNTLLSKLKSLLELDRAFIKADPRASSTDRMGMHLETFIDDQVSDALRRRSAPETSGLEAHQAARTMMRDLHSHLRAEVRVARQLLEKQPREWLTSAQIHQIEQVEREWFRLTMQTFTQNQP